MSDNSNWKETQNKLLQDIEAFSRGDLPLGAVEAAASPAAPAKAGSGFPSLDPNGVVNRSPTQADKPVSAAPQAASVGTAAPAAGGLLEKLRREAQAKQMSESQIFSLQEQRKRHISETLQAAFQYLRDLCEQLNIVKPDYPLAYSLINVVNFDQLAWQEGRADYRTVASAGEDKLFEQVTVRCRLGAPGRELSVERENPAHEVFRNALFENNIVFKEDGVRNERGHVARTLFTFSREVKAGLIFVADYKVGDIRLQLRNLQRFGMAEYRLPPEALTHEALEELGRLLLGEPSRFEKMFRRVA